MSEATVQLPVSLVERFVSVLERMEATVYAVGRVATSPPLDNLLTIEQVAERLQKSRRDVERLVKAGKLRKIPDLGKRTTRFRPADVERFLADKGEAQPGRRRL